MIRSSSSPASSTRITLMILAAISSLIVVHGIGRYAFMPLLPYLVQDHVITLSQGASLATVNYIGYLLGALLAVFLSRSPYAKQYMLGALLINLLSTVVQIFTSSIEVLTILRFANGLSNGLVFVLMPALLLEWLVVQQKSALSGLIFLGVSVGLILDSLLIDWLSFLFEGSKRWIPVALLAIPLALFSLFQLNRLNVTLVSNQLVNADKPLFNSKTTPLFVGYAGAGLGYVLPMTFLPAVAHEVLPQGSFIINNVWLVTAISCLVFIPIWNRLGGIIGDKKTLFWSYIVQILSILILLLFQNIFGVMMCALLMGGSFMATVISSQRLARLFHPDQSTRLYAALISLYAGTQLLGPWATRIWLEHNGSLIQSFYLGLFALIWGLVWTLFLPNHQDVKPAKVESF